MSSPDFSENTELECKGALGLFVLAVGAIMLRRRRRAIGSSGRSPSVQFDHAYRWGLKAAQAGLPRHANPYRASHVRAAWEIGYASHASGGLERYRHR
jgi:hypothetical protein